MSTLTRSVVVGSEEVAARFDRLPGDLQISLERGITRATLRLQARVKGSKLSGQVLNVRTGRLRRSITQRVTMSAGNVTGIVGTNVEYARAHEYGFHGPVTVKEHLRRTKSGAFASVRSHVRKVDLPARSFLRTALAEMAPQIREELENAIARTKYQVFGQ